MLRHGLRALLGLIMLASALGKTLDLPGFIAIIGTYQALPEWAWRPAAFTAVGFEWIIGLWLMLGTRVRGAALMSMGIHAFYAGFAALALWRGIWVPNCGCFGKLFPRPLEWNIPIENGVFFVFAFVLYLLARRPPEPEGRYVPPPGVSAEDE